MRRALYRIELYNNLTHDGHLNRQMHYATDRAAEREAAKWLRNYRRIHAHNPGLCDRWLLIDVTPGRPSRRVSFGDIDGRLPRTLLAAAPPPPSLFD